MAEAEKSKWEVTVTRTGFVIIEASTKEEASSIAEGTDTKNVQWEDSWSITDVERTTE